MKSKEPKVKMAKTKGYIVADSREKPIKNAKGEEVGIFSIADERRLLDVPNVDDPAHPWSYDVRVVTKAEQAIRVEAKWNWQDAYSSWADREDGAEHGRLHRQTRYVDLLLVVWDDFRVELQATPQQRPRIKGLKNRLGRMVLEADPPVYVVGSVDDALSFLKYLRDRTEPIKLGRVATEPELSASRGATPESAEAAASSPPGPSEGPADPSNKPSTA